MSVLRVHWRACLALGAVFGVWATGCAASAAQSASAYAGPPDISGVRISPDGKRILMLRPVDGTLQPFVGDLRTGRTAAPVAIRPGRQLLLGCEWASGERMICSFAKFHWLSRRSEVPADGYPSRSARQIRQVAVDHDGGNRLELVPTARLPPLVTTLTGDELVTFRALSFHPAQEVNYWILSYLPDDPDHILVSLSRENIFAYSVYSLNIHQNAMTLVTPYMDFIHFWSADERGVVRIGLGHRPDAKPQDRRLVVVRDGEGGFRVVGGSGLGTAWYPPRVLGYTADGASAYVEAHDGESGRTVLWQVNAGTLAIERLIAADPRRDIAATPIRGADCGIVGFSDDAAGSFHWLDAAFGAAVEALDARLPGRVRAVPSLTADCSMFIAVAAGGDRSPAYYLHDRHSGETRLLGVERPGLDGQLATPRQIAYPARGGRMIDAALFLPPQPTAAPPPLVVLPKGAPIDAAGGYDPWAQFLASRGYAVLRPAVRGTPGLGEAHWLGGLRMWGTPMQDDMADGVDWLTEQGMVDGDRTCYVGRGLGGYMGLVGAFGAQSRARCAASLAFDEPDNTLNVVWDYRLNRFRRFWDTWVGEPVPSWLSPWDARRALADRRPPESGDPFVMETGGANDMQPTSRSPLPDAPHPGFPVLIGGDGTARTFAKDSRLFDRALGKAGTLERMIPRGSRAEIEFLGALETFLDNQIGRRD